ncbi:MAG: ATP-binding protein, partial [Eubacteriales bacterium]|nr:ATP-binding protein [Eubacteriales bacterium]
NLLELDGEMLEQMWLTPDTLIESAVVQGDEALLSKVVSNVLNNAMLYSPPGASILIEAGDLSLSVENTGVSIPEESLAQLFTPLYRVEQSRNRNSGGSGLGLYLVKVILNLHGATCRIENTERGVRFWAGFA